MAIIFYNVIVYKLTQYTWLFMQFPVSMNLDWIIKIHQIRCIAWNVDTTDIKIIIVTVDLLYK